MRTLIVPYIFIMGYIIFVSIITTIYHALELQLNLHELSKHIAPLVVCSFIIITLVILLTTGILKNYHIICIYGDMSHLRNRYRGEGQNRSLVEIVID